MGLPSKLKNLNVFEDGASYLGQIAEFTLPKLSRQMEDWRGGGMNGPVKSDHGMQAIEAEWTAGGLILNTIRKFGAATVDAVQLRFCAAYQNDENGAVDAVEIVLRGRHEEIDMGNGKPGDNTEHKIKTACAYYKLIVNGVTEIEIDLLNMVEIVGGVDRLAAQRAAIGV